MSGGRATSQMTAPGLHLVMSTMRWPKAEVAVTIRSHWPRYSSARVAMVTVEPGVSLWMVRLSSISRSGSIDTSTTS